MNVPVKMKYEMGVTCDRSGLTKIAAKLRTASKNGLHQQC
jgi:hypothetical protein